MREKIAKSPMIDFFEPRMLSAGCTPVPRNDHWNPIECEPHQSPVSVPIEGDEYAVPKQNARIGTLGRRFSGMFLCRLSGDT